VAGAQVTGAGGANSSESGDAAEDPSVDARQAPNGGGIPLEMVGAARTAGFGLFLSGLVLALSRFARRRS
jgi:hypothetical protein